MTKKTTRTRAEAKKLMWEYFRDNKGVLPERTRQYREEILISLGGGMSAADAFTMALSVMSQHHTSRL